MRTEQYLLKDLDSYFKRHKIATVEQLQNALGNPKKRTVFRKLKMLDYLSSYSHRGKYYTLQSIARFNADGLWSHRAVRFSRFGTLLDTTKALVDHSEAGYTAAELDKALHVETRQSLVQLVRAEQLRREKLQGSYVYFAEEAKKQRGTELSANDANSLNIGLWRPWWCPILSWLPKRPKRLSYCSSVRWMNVSAVCMQDLSP